VWADFTPAAGLFGPFDYMPIDVGPINLHAIEFVAALFAWTTHAAP